MAIIQEWLEEDFERSMTEPAVMVDFFATWCGPCKMMMKVLEKIAAPLDDNAIKIAKIDIEKCPELAARFDVRTVPTFVFFKHGKVQNTMVGVISQQALNEAVQLIME